MSCPVWREKPSADFVFARRSASSSSPCALARRPFTVAIRHPRACWRSSRFPPAPAAASPPRAAVPLLRGNVAAVSRHSPAHGRQRDARGGRGRATERQRRYLFSVMRATRRRPSLRAGLAPTASGACGSRRSTRSAASARRGAAARAAGRTRRRRRSISPCSRARGCRRSSRRPRRLGVGEPAGGHAALRSSATSPPRLNLVAIEAAEQCGAARPCRRFGGRRAALKIAAAAQTPKRPVFAIRRAP